ncbi:unnamed protein product [Durusdinium trenchii]|uniref:Uncharacterized protein n=2 Tax=Durusdinium trenchii TaxID=1381693 RepID=A0ABP0PWG4_9DINO
MRHGPADASPRIGPARLARCVAACWLLCTAGAAKIDEGPELVSDQVVQEAALEAKFHDFKDRYGVYDLRTLDVFFELFDIWIMLYRLNKIDQALVEVLPAVRWRQDEYAIRGLQALAFTRWKQNRHREALARFHEMEGWVGKSAPLCENIGHTYNALGMPKEAEHYFNQSLFYMNAPDSNMSSDQQGGSLLGLAGVREKQQLWAEARQAAQEAYDIYKARDVQRGWDSSLTAKAAMAVSKMDLKLGNLEQALAKAEEALRLFELTSGSQSPLMSTAYRRMGEIYMKKGLYVEARQAFHKAYKLEAVKDAFDLTEIVILHQSLMDAHLGRGPLQRSAFRVYFRTAAQVLKRVKELKQDGNAGAYYKLAGELFVLGEDCKAGAPLLSMAVSLLQVETAVDTKLMVKASRDLISYCKGSTKHLEEQYLRGEL